MTQTDLQKFKKESDYETERQIDRQHEGQRGRQGQIGDRITEKGAETNMKGETEKLRVP